MDYPKQPEKKELEKQVDILSTGLQGKTLKEIADEAVNRAYYIIAQVRKFKEPRIAQVKKYRNLYAGNIPKKYRQIFNVTLPVFAGAIDTLQSAFNDDLALKFVEQEPADYTAAKKVSALWDMEVNSTAPNAKFALKARWDRANAIFSGRGFMKNYASSIPDYCNHFEIFELDDAIFQPLGGGHLENHLYAGQENIIRSESQLLKGECNKEQVKKLIEISAKTDYMPIGDQEIYNYLAKFKAVGLDPTTSDYIGERVFNLTEIVLTMGGERYYLLFSPWYRTWLRFEKNSVLSSSNRYPYVSWATHEDNRNFLTKSYADDLYGVADSIHTLFNQELTNREKKNFNARAFDKEMFPDVAKLDLAQYRPDALVPADTKGGSRRISEGIYKFETADLGGTIDLIQYMNEESGRSVGVTDLSMGGVQNVSKKATVVFAEQQNISKRLLLRSSSYTEGMGEIGKLFLHGLKDHMPAKKAIKLIGESATGWDEIKRMDLDTYSDLDIRIISSSLDMKNSMLKKESRMKTLAEISADPAQAQFVNPRSIVEEKLRSGGEFDDAEISILMDTKNYGNKEEQSYAHKAIQQIIQGEETDLYYGATTIFLEIIYQYARNYKSKIGDAKYDQLLDYINAHGAIVNENMERLAGEKKQALSEAKLNSQIIDPNANNGATPPVEDGKTAPNINSALSRVKSDMKV